MTETNSPAPLPGLGHNNPPPDDVLLTATEAAEMLGLTRAGFYQAIAAGRLPNPVYPAARAPRWWRSRLIRALDATELSPSEARAARRQARIAASTT